jgi:hypothetical protein
MAWRPSYEWICFLEVREHYWKLQGIQCYVARTAGAMLDGLEAELEVDMFSEGARALLEAPGHTMLRITQCWSNAGWLGGRAMRYKGPKVHDARKAGEGPSPPQHHLAYIFRRAYLSQTP